VSVKDDIYDTLVGDANYLTLMGDPSTKPYRTFYEQPPEPPEFPQTVFQFIGGVPDQSFGPEIIYTERQMRVSVWTEDDSYQNIINRIVSLLHQTTGAGRTWKAFFSSIILDGVWEEEFEVWRKTIEFIVHYGRAIA